METETENDSKWVICRICLKEGAEMLKIFEDTAQNLVFKIEECGGIELDAAADLPDSICTKCVTLLKAAIKFRTICQRTQQLLNKQFGHSVKDQKDTNAPPDFPVEFLKFKEKAFNEETSDFLVHEKVVEANPVTLEELPGDCYNIEFAQPQEIPNESEHENSVLASDEVGFELVKEEDVPSESQQDMVEYVLQLDEDYQKDGNYKIIEQIKKKPVRAIASEPATTKQKRKQQNYENADGNFKCPTCQNVYYNKHKLVSHLKMHNQDKPHECEICFKRFAQTPQLARHMNTHTGQRPFQCPHCPASFADPSTRIKHIRTHTNERPYKCNVCNKSFTYSNVLKVHQMTHTGEKPFSCRHCGKKFSQSHHKKNHERTHPTYEALPLC